MDGNNNNNDNNNQEMNTSRAVENIEINKRKNGRIQIEKTKKHRTAIYKQFSLLRNTNDKVASPSIQTLISLSIH